MRTLRLILIPFATLLAVSCAPAVTGFDVIGGEEACTISLACGSDEPCDNVAYSIVCTLNITNEIYECQCLADGEAGDTFEEAGVCDVEGAGFPNVDLADAAGHAANDCGFPVAAPAEGEEEEE